MSLALAGLLLAAAAPPDAPAPLGGSPLILDRGRADRAPPPPPPIEPAPAGGSARVATAGAATPIRGIAFDGAKVPAAVAAAAARFVGRPAERATLDALAQAMAAAYADTDVALYTVLVPAQSLAGGVVHIRVIEGHVEAVRFTAGETPLLRARADRLLAERPLSRRTWERSLSLMRDVPGRTLDIKVLPGRTLGGVVLQVAATAKRRDVSLGFDNRGTDLLGAGQVRAEAHGYSLLRDGDRTDLIGLAATDLDRFRYLAISHATPIGADGLAASASFGYLRTRPRRSIVTGDARTAAIGLSWPLVRGFRRNVSLSATLDGLDSDAAVFGTVVSADHTRALRIAAGGAQAGKRATLSGSLVLSRGLAILDARGTPGFTETVFTKVNARLGWDRQLGKRLFVRLRAAGQHSRARLAPAERFAVGGADFGRAFEAAVLTGDRGIAGLGELALRLKLPEALAGSELYGFADGARIAIEPRGRFRGARYDLASAGAGVRLAYTPRAFVELEAARAIDRPYPGYRGRWRINVAWRLSLKK